MLQVFLNCKFQHFLSSRCNRSTSRRRRPPVYGDGPLSRHLDAVRLVRHGERHDHQEQLPLRPGHPIGRRPAGRGAYVRRHARVLPGRGVAGRGVPCAAQQRVRGGGSVRAVRAGEHPVRVAGPDGDLRSDGVLWEVGDFGFFAG